MEIDVIIGLPSLRNEVRKMMRKAFQMTLVYFTNINGCS